MNFGIIIPVYNGEKSIVLILQSPINQSIVPCQTIVVGDGSTDNTAQLVSEIAVQHPRIQLVQCREKGEHQLRAKIVQASNSGFPYLKKEVDVICKYDADLAFPANYFGVMNICYSENQQLGTYGGFCYIKQGDVWVPESLTNKDCLCGAVKSYRKARLEAIGGLKTAMGQDTADELLACYHGWEVQISGDPQVEHLCPTGTGYKSNAKYLQGSVFYRSRYGIILILFAAAKLAIRKCSLALSFNYLRGYLKARRERQPYLLSEEEGRWVRDYRQRGIAKKVYKS